MSRALYVSDLLLLVIVNVSILANIAFLVGEKSEVTLFHDDDFLGLLIWMKFIKNLAMKEKREAAQLCDTQFQPSIVMEID